MRCSLNSSRGVCKALSGTTIDVIKGDTRV